MIRYLFLLSLLVAVLVSARRIPDVVTQPAFRNRGSTTFRYPYGWGLDAADLLTSFEEGQNQQPQSMPQCKQVKAVKRDSGKTEQTTTANNIPTRRASFLFSPSPQDHFDDIFLSSAGLDQ